MITSKDGRLEHQASDSEDYVWQFGARKLAEYLAGGPKPRFSPEHSVHVVQIPVTVKAALPSAEPARLLTMITLLPSRRSS